MLNVSKLHEVSSKGEVYIGMSSTSIAPTWPVVLPYGKQVPTTNFYNRNIFCKTLVIRVNDIVLTLIACDVIGFKREDVEFIKDHIERECDVKKDFITLVATHNHSYPRVSNERVRNFLKDKIVESVNDALNSMFKAKIGFGKDRLPTWINVNRARPNGPVDTTLYVMKIEDYSGVLRGIVFSFPSHPNIYTTAWGGTKLGKIGPEWPEYVRKYVEANVDKELMFQLYPQAEFRNVFTMFLLGGAGDLQPSLIVYRRKGELIDRRRAFVETLGNYILKLTDTIKTSSSVSLTFRWANVSLPFREEYIENIKRMIKEGRIPKRYITQVKSLIEKGSYDALIQAIMINNACICTAPGEVTAELGMFFQKRSGFEYPILVTVANDYLGYFVSELEGEENVRYEAQGSPFCASRGRILINAILSLVNPKAILMPPIDVKRDLGCIEGYVDYESSGDVYVGVKRECTAPAYGEPPAAPFLGKRVRVEKNGHFKIKRLAPGIVYLYVDEVLREGERPRLLMWGEPVNVKPGSVVKVKLNLPREFHGVGVDKIEIKDVKIEGYNILCNVKVYGEVTSSDILRGYLFRYQDTLKHHKTYLYTPLTEAIRVNDESYVFTNISPGDYAILFWIDVNENGRPEHGVDILSPMKKLMLEDFYEV